MVFISDIQTTAPDMANPTAKKVFKTLDKLKIQYRKDVFENWKIEKVSKETIIKVANSISLNTIYFLKDNGSAKEDN